MTPFDVKAQQEDIYHNKEYQASPETVTREGAQNQSQAQKSLRNSHQRGVSETGTARESLRNLSQPEKGLQNSHEGKV